MRSRSDTLGRSARRRRLSAHCTASDATLQSPGDCSHVDWIAHLEPSARSAFAGRRPVACLAVAALLLLTGCLYSFTGGGLPRHIRTVAVVQFENETSQPLVESELETRLQQELPRNLGVRLAGESTADAVVRGRITGYEETAASVRPAAAGERIPVVQRQVRITYEAEIYDMREDRPLWQARSQSVIANFQPDSESVEVGRTRAIQELVRRVIEGAQSQW